jgi:hypothetical protein
MNNKFEDMFWNFLRKNKGSVNKGENEESVNKGENEESVNKGENEESVNKGENINNRNFYIDFYKSLKFLSKINYLCVKNLIPQELKEDVYKLKRQKHAGLFVKYKNLPDEYKEIIKIKYNIDEERTEDIIDLLMFYVTFSYILEENFRI